MAAETVAQNSEQTSGPDQGGPIWGHHFVPNQPARSITSEGAVPSGFDAWLKGQQAKGKYAGYDPDAEFMAIR